MNAALNNLVASWMLAGAGIIAALALHPIVGAVIVLPYYGLRSKANIPRLGGMEILNQIPGWPFFSTLYYLVLCVLAFLNLERIYGLGVAVPVLLVFFPLAVPAAVLELRWYRQLKSNQVLQ